MEKYNSLTPKAGQCVARIAVAHSCETHRYHYIHYNFAGNSLQTGIVDKFMAYLLANFNQKVSKTCGIGFLAIYGV